MAEYTSTAEGFQRAMKWSLTGPPQEAKVYAEATVMPNFYQIMNNEKLSYDVYIKGIEDWRGKISDYEPTVFNADALAIMMHSLYSHEFLRDGDKLASRMTGTITFEGAASFFESFMFGKVNKETGKLEWLIERSVWGLIGGEAEHGVN